MYNEVHKKIFSPLVISANYCVEYAAVKAFPLKRGKYAIEK